jgi:hypothetical protein
MRMKVKASILGLTGAVAFSALAPAAKAADTTVICKGPVATVNTGKGDGTPPRFTIHCSGGSSAGSITFFAYEIAVNPTVALLLSQAFETYITRYSSANPGVAVPIASNLSDTSGDAWGCGAGNCRIIDYLVAK